MKRERNPKGGPSRGSLKEIPEVDWATAVVKPNPYLNRMRRLGYSIHAGRGRPRKGEETGGTSPRSIRFPDDIWTELESLAKANGLTVHAALRTAVVEWMSRSGGR